MWCVTLACLGVDQIGHGSTMALANARGKVEGQKELSPLVPTAIGWASFMVISSNFRYQVRAPLTRPIPRAESIRRWSLVASPITSLRFTGLPVPITARVHSITPQRPFPGRFSMTYYIALFLCTGFGPSLCRQRQGHAHTTPRGPRGPASTYRTTPSLNSSLPARW
eukprot:1047970-Prorocentrum_minimum.AAC.1